MHILDLPDNVLGSVVASIFSEDRRTGLSLLTTCSRFYQICQPLFHSELTFTSVRQLSCFSENCCKFSSRPKILDISIPGGICDFSLFPAFYYAVRHILSILSDEGEDDNNIRSPVRLSLNRLRFCLNSHICDPNTSSLSRALSLVEYVAHLLRLV